MRWRELVLEGGYSANYAERQVLLDASETAT